ncbi:MAG: hypothetical protein JOS17DRAFT_190089, partial [Linnemannia elongata]
VRIFCQLSPSSSTFRSLARTLLLFALFFSLNPFPTSTKAHTNTNMAPAIFGLRLWMAFVTLVNLSLLIAYYGYLVPSINKHAEQTDYNFPYQFYWGDYAIIIASVILFPAYLYSILGKKPLVSNKYGRAALMLLPALFLLGLQIHQIDVTIKMVKWINERRSQQFGEMEPFSCADSDGIVDPDCALSQSHTFVPVVTGFFVIIEVAVTLFRGPLHSPKET